MEHSNIIPQDNFLELAELNPNEIFASNKTSHDRCIQFGERLLDEIKTNGMSDELELEASSFITKAKNTISKMNDNRKPLTKIFDILRAQFTALENDIDVAKKDTIPYLIQIKRNEYAQKKREEAERIRQQQLQQQEREHAIANFRVEVEQFYKSYYVNLKHTLITELADIYKGITLDNVQESRQKIEVLLYDKDFSVKELKVNFPVIVGVEVLQQINNDTYKKIVPELQEDIKGTIIETAENYLALLPSKVAELQNAATMEDSEEAERIRQQIQQRDEEEKQKIISDCIKNAAQQQLEEEMQKSALDIDNAFNTALASTPVAQQNVAVKKKIVPLNTDAFPLIISMWWSNEGQNLSVDELSKIFKKQISFCEKMAKKGELIQSEHIEYVEDIKAK